MTALPCPGAGRSHRQCVRGAGLKPLLTDQPRAQPPPAAWPVVERGALGALVINRQATPARMAVLKIKGHFGVSVEGDFNRPGRAPPWRPVASPCPVPGVTPRFEWLGRN